MQFCLIRDPYCSAKRLLGSNKYSSLGKTILNSTGTYSSSFYKVVANSGRHISPFMLIWKAKVPPTVQVFAFLLLHDKLPTREMLLRRRFTVLGHCLLCGHCPSKLATHIFFLCPISVQMWYIMEHTSRLHLMVPAMILQKIFAASNKRPKATTKMSTWIAYFIARCWQLWKTRNGIVLETATDHLRWWQSWL